jgi:ketosteroid isomerase-like protein
VQPYGDTAIATGIVVIKGTSKGKDVSGRSQWTDTWIKRGGQWQCVASHSTRITKK